MLLAPSYSTSANDCMETHLALEGDYYREQPIYRGLTISSACTAAAVTFGGEELWDAQPLGLFQKEQFGFDRFARQSQKEFMQSDFPPTLPQEPFFKLELTTVHIDAEDAAEVGNRLLAFLNTIAAKVLKVNTKKFTVKAAVLCEGLTCITKVRVYSRKGFPRLALEFQRYSGDCVAHNKTFQQAAQFLTLQASKTLPPNCTQLQSDKELDVQSLLPLLDAARRSSDVSFQAEVAAGLLAASESMRGAGRLCVHLGVRSAILKLLQVPCFTVAAPLSLLLSNLALCQEAEEHLFRNGFLGEIFVQALTASVGRLLKDRLTEALRILLQRCRAELSCEAFDELIDALEVSKADEEDSAAKKAIESAVRLLPAPRNLP